MADIQMRLTGGLFYLLLFNARNQPASQRKRVKGERDGLSRPEMLVELIKIVSPSYVVPIDSEGRIQDSMGTIATNYGTCKIKTSALIPFDDDEIIEKFDKSVRFRYSGIYRNMSLFVKRFIDVSEKGARLVANILEIMFADQRVEEDAEFIIKANQRTVSKAGLKDIKEYDIVAFLLAILHYIICNKVDNTEGRDTFDFLFEKASNGEWKYKSNIGKDLSEKIHVTYNDKVEKPMQEEVVPDLAEGIPLLVLSANIAEGKRHPFEEYLKKAKEKHSMVKTLLYIDAPIPFYDIYVCNDINYYVSTGRFRHRIETIRNATINSLTEVSRFLILSGTGGIGKSMMMRHLLLSAIDDFEDSGKLPIFVSLKDYKKEESLYDFILERINGLDENGFQHMIRGGNCILLFDGLDEISSTYSKAFESALELFVDEYSENIFVISSRPYSTFGSYSRFTTLQMRPFSKEKSLELINRLNFRADEPEIKEAFCKDLKERLYNTHRSFAENPLLLTIMLMTYEQYAEIPSQMHLFYQEAYAVLAQRHDANKNSYKRELKTGLTTDKFADLFAEFCARTYRDEKFEFTETEFMRYFSQVSTQKRVGIRGEDFMYDLVSNMCLMYFESQKYHFTHRSFQEYFTAVFYSRQKDKALQKIGLSFDERTDNNRSYGDATFEMLYSMIPEKVEEYIFLPFLENMVNKCQNGLGVWTYYGDYYPTIYYDCGDVNCASESKPSSFLLSFIIGRAWYLDDIPCDVLPHKSDLVTTEYVYLEDDWYCDHEDYDEDDCSFNKDGLMDADDVPSEYLDDHGDPKPVGWNHEIEISDILDDPIMFGDFIHIMSQENFVLHKQYERLLEYYEELKERVQDDEDDDFFADLI